MTQATAHLIRIIVSTTLLIAISVLAFTNQTVIQANHYILYAAMVPAWIALSISLAKYDALP